MLKVARLQDRMQAVAELHDLYHARGAQRLLPMRVECATSEFDLPSLTSLSVAGCGRLQLGVHHWATSVITAST